MHHSPIIPEGHRTRCPFPAYGEIVGVQEVLAEECEDMVGFLAVEFFNVGDE